MPVKPYCSDDLSTGLRIRKKEKALEMLVKSDYEKLRDKAGEEGLLCHGEYNQHNVLLCKNQVKRNDKNAVASFVPNLPERASFSQ